MSWWKPWEKRSVESPTVPLSDPSALADLFGFELVGTSIHVDRKAALTIPAFWSGVQFISNTMASLPLKVYQNTDDGRVDVTDETPIGRILSFAINRGWTSHRWRKYSQQEIFLSGRSLTLILRGNGLIQGFRALNPSEVTVTTDNIGRTIYEAEGRRYPEEDIIDVPWMLGADGITSVPPIQRHRETFALAIGLTRYAAQFFESGGVPPLSLEGPITSGEAARRAADDVKQALKNRKNKNIMVLPDGHKLTQVGFHPEQGQLVDARRMQVEEIARILNIPPTFLQDLTHGTFSNTEQQDLHFVKHSLSQWTKAWEQELNLKLFPDQGRFVEFNLDGLLRGDFKTRMEGFSRAIQSGVMTPNEARRKENRPEIAGGDKLYMQGAMKPIEDLSNEQAGNENGESDA